MKTNHDAVLVVSFGGPDGPDDVIPFLRNVSRGRHVPPERLRQAAQRYAPFGGVSPINAQNQALVAALAGQLGRFGPHLPVYLGNRNWHPLLLDTIRRMVDDGRRRALAFFTTPYSSYANCRQYREDIEWARAQVGSQAPEVDKLRAYYNHPGFIEPIIERLQQALLQIPGDRRNNATILYTAHSIPRSMAENCRYEAQVSEASRLVSEAVQHEDWRLVYQSRSGLSSQPWLGPDICDILRQIAAAQAARDVVVVPIGFVSDHMEVVCDLDTEAHNLCRKLGLNMVRAATVGTQPRFIKMIRQLILERITEHPIRLALGQFGPSHDVCPEDCCLWASRR